MVAIAGDFFIFPFAVFHIADLPVHGLRCRIVFYASQVLRDKGLGGLVRLLSLLLLFSSSYSAFAVSVEGVDFPDQKTIGSQKWVLNGAGLRIKKKFGMSFPVYVGALYLPAKNQDEKALIGSKEAKMMELVFLRKIDASTLRDAWSEGFDKNCKPECDAARAQFKTFNELMVDVKDKSRLKMTFTGDEINVEVEGITSKSGKLSGEAIRKALLAIFIGDEPPTADLKKALLGKS